MRSGNDRPLIVSALDRFIDRLSLRSTVGAAERQAILSLPGSLVSTPAHRDIVRPGQQTDFSCLIVDGLAARFDQLANGERQITAIHIPGDMCDLHSVPVPVAGWGIGAASATTTYQVPHAALKSLAVQFPELGFSFWRDTVVDASILAKWISALGRRNSKERLAHFYCEMGLRLEQAGLGDRRNFSLPLVQTHLADVLGITAVHLNRTIQALRHEGVLSAENHGVHILDYDRLLRIAQFDPEYLLLPRDD